jgi:predicted ATP-dependent endonuclease of OLD family
MRLSHTTQTLRLSCASSQTQRRLNLLTSKPANYCDSECRTSSALTTTRGCLRASTAVGRGDTGEVQDIREEANKELAKRMEAWQQDPPVRVTLDTEGALLRIHVQSGTGPTMQFRDRSDGLRQFVALVALTAQHDYTVPPILLIDEVETHLHYNAQADLIEVLTTQTAARQVVYTTHSAACLPQDLGLGVRVVEGIGQLTASTVRQNLWQAEHPGLGSLLMAMGASSLVYVTLRPGVIAEGESDLILLPTLIREAIDKDSLGFAVVPGASTTPPERIAGLDLQGVKTVWVLDADDAGRLRRGQLSDAHIPEERILLLDDDTGLEIEDLIEPDAYVHAVQLYVADVGGTDEFRVADLPAETCQRHETVEAWCDARELHRPSKIAIANKIIELAGSTPLLDPQHVERVRTLHGRITDLFAS